MVCAPNPLWCSCYCWMNSEGNREEAAMEKLLLTVFSLFSFDAKFHCSVLSYSLISSLQFLLSKTKPKLSWKLMRTLQSQTQVHKVPDQTTSGTLETCTHTLLGPRLSWFHFSTNGLGYKVALYTFIVLDRCTIAGQRSDTNKLIWDVLVKLSEYGANTHGAISDWKNVLYTSKLK